jgi:response regulator RpfG family c-di-GMP phosphodiesterase
MDFSTENSRRVGEPYDHSDAKGRVLVSGTQNDTRFMMKVLLEMWGYEVAEANGISETVEQAETFAPHFVLVDTSRLFDQDIEVVSSLRGSKLGQSVPVFVMSGFSQSAYLKSAMEHGATGLLVKPLDLDMLEKHLDSARPANGLHQYR